LKDWIKYGLANATIGFIIGLFLTFFASGNSYYVLSITAPLASFIVGGLFWQLMVRNIRDTSQIVIVGLLTGTIAHYITFILLNIGLNICYWLTGGCTDPLGGPPPSIWFMLGGAFPLSCFSLLFCGWITVPCSILIGLILQRTKNNKKT